MKSESIFEASFNKISGISTYIAGDGYALTDRQFQLIVGLFWDEMQHPGLLPMVGVISLSMGQIYKRIRWAHLVGIRRFQISLFIWEY